MAAFELLAALLRARGLRAWCAGDGELIVALTALKLPPLYTLR